jgi:hypothetical protein
MKQDLFGAFNRILVACVDAIFRDAHLAPVAGAKA